VERAVFATNTLIEGMSQSGSFSPGDRLTFKTELPSVLNDGEYYIEPAIANESATTFFDQINKAHAFFINGSKNPHSILSSEQPLSLTISKGTKK
jgi:hypothetical protein